MQGARDNSEKPLLADEVHLGILNSLDLGVCFIDFRGVVRFWNSTAESLTGISKAEALTAKAVEDVFACCDHHGVPLPEAFVRKGLRGESPIRSRLFMRHRDGHQAPIEIRAFQVAGEDQQPIGAAALFCLISGADLEMEAQDLGEKPQEGPEYERADPDWIRAQVAQRLHHKSGAAAGILLISIDGLETHEERLGHEAASRLVDMVSKTASASLKPGDSSGGWENDSELVLLNASDSEKVHGIGERIQRLVAASGILWWGETVKVTVTIAATLTRNGDTLPSVSMRLNEALAQGQAQGGNRLVFV